MRGRIPGLRRMLLALALVVGGSVGGAHAQALTITTLAGSPGSGWHDGVGAAAEFSRFRALAADGAGNLYVADTFNHTIRKIVVATGEVTTLAGTAGESGSADGVGAAARFRSPRGVVADGAGHLYVADSGNYRIRKIVIATGEVTTFAGQFLGFGDGVGPAASFTTPCGMVLDGLGNLYVVDQSAHTIRKIVIATRAVTTVAGTGGQSGSTDGMGAAARFQNPTEIAVDGDGNLYVADRDNHTIRKIVVATGAVTTFAGSAGKYGSEDGVGAAARFSSPYGVATDGEGNLFVAETFRVRKVVLATAAVSSVAGGNLGSGDGVGAAAGFSYLSGIVSDGSGNLYVADERNRTVRKVEVATARVTTLAGSPGWGFSDGVSTRASFDDPRGIAVDAGGNLFVADRENHTIRRVSTSTGEVTTFAGRARSVGSTDGIGAAARFYYPEGIAADGAGNLYVADTSNHTIRKIVVATGEVTTLAGTAGESGSADGVGAAARFYRPEVIAADGAGNLYVGHYPGALRRVVVETGEVTTLARTGEKVCGLAAGPSGQLFFSVCDFTGHQHLLANAIRRAVPRLPDAPVIDQASAPIGQARQLDTSPQTATSWRWEVVRRPSGGEARFSDAAVRNPTFTPDRADLWVLRLSASGPAGMLVETINFQGQPTTATRDLTVARAGTGSGTVASTPAGIDCGATCTAPFTYGTVVTLRASADAGSTFTGWSGACSGTGPCDVTINGDKTATASFAGSGHLLTVTRAGTGVGTVVSIPAGIDCGATCSAAFASGTAVTLTAAPAAGSTFAGWSGACSGTGACELTMDGARAVTATFAGAMPSAARLFPGVASLAGSGGTRWRSDMVMWNDSGAEQTATLDLIPRDSATVATSASRLVPAGQLVRFADLYAELGASSGAGMLRLTGPVMSWVRTFNDRGGDGTFGQDVPPIADSDGYIAGAEILFPITTPANQASDFRSNLLLLNLETTPITVTLAAGSKSTTRVVAGGTYTQLNNVGGLLSLPAGVAVLKATATGRWAGTVSTVDPVSGDPTTVRGLPMVPQSVVLYPGVASVAGAVGTQWRSEVVLFNPAATERSVLLDLIPRGSSTVAKSTSLLLQPLEVRRLADLYAELQAASGAGMLRATGDVLSWVRTYNQSPTATFGQDVPPVLPAAGVEAGRFVLFPVSAPADTAKDFRSNLILYNHGTATLTVTVAAAGKSKTTTVPAAAYAQVNDVGTWLGLSPGWASITVSGNGRWSGTVSTIDPKTGDPTTMIGIIRP